MLQTKLIILNSRIQSHCSKKQRMVARIHCAQEYCSQKASPRYPYTDDNEQQIRYPVFQTVIRTGRQLSKGSVNVKLQESFLRPLLVLKYRSLSYSTACMKCQDEKDLRCDNRKYLRTFSRNSSRTAQSICQKMFKAVSVEHGAIYIQRLFSMLLQQNVFVVPPMTMKSNVVQNSN